MLMLMLMRWRHLIHFLSNMRCEPICFRADTSSTEKRLILNFEVKTNCDSKGFGNSERTKCHANLTSIVTIGRNLRNARSIRTTGTDLLPHTCSIVIGLHPKKSLETECCDQRLILLFEKPSPLSKWLALRAAATDEIENPFRFSKVAYEPFLEPTHAERRIFGRTRTILR